MKVQADLEGSLKQQRQVVESSQNALSQARADAQRHAHEEVRKAEREAGRMARDSVQREEMGRMSRDGHHGNGPQNGAVAENGPGPQSPQEVLTYT